MVMHAPRTLDALARFEEAAKPGVTAFAFGPQGWSVAVQFAGRDEPFRCSAPTLHEALVLMTGHIETSPDVRSSLPQPIHTRPVGFDCLFVPFTNGDDR